MAHGARCVGSAKQQFTASDIAYMSVATGLRRIGVRLGWEAASSRRRSRGRARVVGFKKRWRAPSGPTVMRRRARADRPRRSIGRLDTCRDHRDVRQHGPTKASGSKSPTTWQYSFARRNSFATEALPAS